MKIRSGFISNSSSSSFIVFFPRRPKTIRDVELILFGPQAAKIPRPYMRYAYTTRDIATTVFNDLSPISAKETIEELLIRDGWCYNLGEDYTRFPRFNHDWDDPDYVEKREKFEKDICDPPIRKWLARKYKKYGMNTYLFTYADEDGPYFAMLEHGEIWGKLPYIMFSNH